MHISIWKKVAGFIAICSVVLQASGLMAAEWPQWRGLNRDGRSPETGLLQAWPEGGPLLLWSADGIGKGYGSAAVTSDRIYVTGSKERTDVVSALDLKGGLEWQTPIGKSWNRSFPDCRITPTVDGNRIYVATGAGDLVCLDADKGSKIWSLDVFGQFAGKFGRWGYAESPLAVDNRVVLTPGGSKTTMVAVNKRTGDIMWTSKALGDQVAYVSPILIEHKGIAMIVMVTGSHVIGVGPQDGEILWDFNYAGHQPPPENPEVRAKINAISPLYHQGHLLVTSGYDHVAVKLKLSANGRSVTPVWTTPNLDCHLGGVVLVEGYLYGSSWEGNNDGKWLCLDWQTGAVQYEQAFHNKGSVIHADQRLYCQVEGDGVLALVRCTPQAFDVVSSFELPKRKVRYWAHPAIADGRLYVRIGDMLQAYDIRAK